MKVSHVDVTPATDVDGKPPQLLDQVRARMRRLGLAPRTEEAYVGWIRRFILSQGKRHPRDMGAPEVEAFLTDLAVRRRVAAATQNQALATLLFLYRKVLGIELPWMTEIRRAKRPKRLPTVLGHEEVSALLGELSGVHWLMASLLYGSGLRLLECLRLRMQDVDFARRELLVRQGKGDKDRRTVLPAGLEAPAPPRRNRAAARCEACPGRSGAVQHSQQVLLRWQGLFRLQPTELRAFLRNLATVRRPIRPAASICRSDSPRRIRTRM